MLGMSKYAIYIYTVNKAKLRVNQTPIVKKRITKIQQQMIIHRIIHIYIDNGIMRMLGGGWLGCRVLWYIAIIYVLWCVSGKCFSFSFQKCVCVLKINHNK